jgi:hypothetical protein
MATVAETGKRVVPVDEFLLTHRSLPKDVNAELNLTKKVMNVAKTALTVLYATLAFSFAVDVLVYSGSLFWIGLIGLGICVLGCSSKRGEINERLDAIDKLQKKYISTHPVI